MPVTTRSKRKTIDMGEVPVKPKRRLVDVTNRKGKNIKAEKSSQISSHKSDGVLYTLKPMIPEEADVKPTTSQLLPALSNGTLREFPTVNSQASSEDALRVMKKVKKTLKSGFKNAAQRLQLDVIPDCLFDITKCHENHNSKKVPRKPSLENVFVAKLYLAEERHFQFCHHVRRNLVASKLYPGSDVLCLIIQEIMKFKSKDAHYTTSFVLSELHNVFITILNTFPPCHVQDYLKLFTSVVKIDGLPEKKQILPTVFDLIHDLIYINDNAKLDESIQIDFNKNFYMWDLEHSENSTFTNLSRNDRFNRVFMVMDLLVRILEYDTAIFVCKYSHQFASTINKKQKRPLICSVIWKEFGNLMTINATVKNIISTFIVMTALKYPLEKIRIVSRLLNLIINVINMYEYPDDTVQYPLYKAYTTNLVNEIQKTVESSLYYSMELYINVIENIRSPTVRMLLTSQLYSKIIGQSLQISLDVPFKAIYNRDFRKFSQTPKVPKETKKKNEIYPRYDAKKVAKKCKVMQDDFIKLMMLYSDAVIKNFHLVDIINEIKKTEDQGSQLDVEMKYQPTKFKRSDFVKQLESIDLNEKVNLRSIDLNFQTMVHIRLTKDNCTFYRNEVKNLPLIIKLIKKCHQKYGSQFDEWLQMVDEIQRKI